MYKYEMHLHTNVCSACGISSGEEMVKVAKEKGYTGIVITNHFYHGNTAISRRTPWREFVKAYKEDYLDAKKAGEKYGIEVLFGIEEGYGKGKETLIYGISPELLMDTPDFSHMTIVEMSKFVRANNGFIVAAHPFRVRDYIAEPRKAPDTTLFDALETYNHINSFEDNDLAEQLCKKSGLLRTSGGDVHSIHGIGNAGLAFYERITNNEQLVTALKAGNYKLIISGEIEE